MRLLGPALGYTLASLCLKLYISPDLTPIITDRDIRWLGAWWLGWLIFALVLFVCSISTMMFPRELPRAAVRRRLEKEKIKRGLKEPNSVNEFIERPEETKASVSDMIVTYKRLFKNRIYMLMHVSGILHLFG
jgi:solute carrier organic anion transporter family, member 5A